MNPRPEPLAEASYRAFREFEHAGWERAASDYMATFGRVTSLVIEPLLDAAGIATGQRILDVACGPGLVAVAAIHRGARAMGIDFSAAMVRAARRSCPAAEFQEADALSLPFVEASFDATVSNLGVHHTPDPDRALAEMARVLRRGGRLAFSVWDEPARSEGQHLLQAAIHKSGVPDVPLPTGPSAHRFADAAEVARALGEIGLGGIETVPCPVAWRAPSADDLFHGFLHGTVRLGSVLRAQPPELLGGIRDTFRRLLDPHRVPEGIALPMQAVISSAFKP